MVVKTLKQIISEGIVRIEKIDKLYHFVTRERQKNEDKDRKVLEILRIKDDKILDLQRCIDDQAKEIGFLSNKYVFNILFYVFKTFITQTIAVDAAESACLEREVFLKVGLFVKFNPTGKQ